MNSKAIIAILAVVVVVAAGAGVVVLTHNNSHHETLRNSNNLDGRLTVFGNANNDDFLDSRDVDFVKKVIAGEEKATYYTCYKTFGGSTVQRSFCDANVDGKIDQADVDWIQNMVDRKNNMLLYFYDVDGVIGSCTYPLTTSAVGYKSNYEALLVLGEADLCKYTCNQVGNDGAYSKWYSAFSDAKCYGSRFTPDYETFVGAEPSYILSGTRNWFDPEMEEKCGPMGIDV
ncbi:MAG: dockerin type I domain-containing protein, partial [Methanomethylophilus sp.]|nr:dockerin type I domain-containing protein [Methanomethylophilus sp.]